MEKDCTFRKREHLVFPKRLEKGDTVALVCPSSPTSSERVMQCADLIRKQGYEVRVSKNCCCRLHGYLAGEASARAEEINRMFADDSVKAIFCIRGGYGSSQIMNLLDYDMIRKHPKIFVGYSDVTNLLSAFLQLCGMVTFHGPMVSSNMLEHFDTYTEQSFFDTIGMGEELIYHNAPGQKLVTVKEGRAEGILVGGNLALVTSMIGTFYSPDFRGKILFLEDVNESIPRIHRMLDQLRLTGILGQVKGILLGDFADSSNPDDKEYETKDLWADFFKEYRKPVFSNLSCGHSFPTATLPIGTYCTMDTCNQQICFYR